MATAGPPFTIMSRHGIIVHSGELKNPRTIHRALYRIYMKPCLFKVSCKSVYKHRRDCDTTSGDKGELHPITFFGSMEDISSRAASSHLSASGINLACIELCGIACPSTFFGFEFSRFASIGAISDKKYTLPCGTSRYLRPR